MTPNNPDRVTFRKRPQQERSIQRVDAILSVAAALIAEKGVSRMKMTELAAVATIPIGSVYQYFPDKAAIVRALLDRHSNRIQQKVREAFSVVTSLDHAIELACGMIDWYYREYRSDPAYLGVWLGTDIDRDILKLNIEHSNRVAEMFLESIRPFLPAESRIDLEARTQLFSHLIGASVRFAIMSDDDMAKRMLHEWKQVIRATLLAEPI
ncbi:MULTISPECIES: TetR/AcrR family transcriptional regulator [unclassified Rhizobium]|jgi:AcrR family transcriptional regulator|uniref:TetR/AcrR family transcriptional regulator n=1 Tax=unclassified Rhizobium TaxID=2613769 RepID=UPI000645710B|nr:MULTISPECIES: TetR/AcrR family transcriptional regulator [unclassified Rhizobium]MBN8950270.1 TetR family transcriptional regulator [Rhizobium tropici]OJY68813.1 MAG: TetR family transcriptional regulator [Rhizobium sp. 60-20]RKD74432.1 TetR family transcriptional regulator [Rhizobium sp. WW_1]